MHVLYSNAQYFYTDGSWAALQELFVSVSDMYLSQIMLRPASEAKNIGPLPSTDSRSSQPAGTKPLLLSSPPSHPCHMLPQYHGTSWQREARVALSSRQVACKQGLVFPHSQMHHVQ